VITGGVGLATEQTADLGADLGAYSGRIIIGIGL
jgi:HJR/Mrr/RecB family endonuclease